MSRSLTARPPKVLHSSARRAPRRRRRSSAAEQRPTVDVEKLPRHVGGVIGGQEEDTASNVVRETSPPEHCARDQTLVTFLGHAIAKELGPLDVAGDNRVNPDAVIA